MNEQKSRKKNGQSAEAVVCRNRRAQHEYHLFESLEAGIVLTGTEVKSLRAGNASLEDSYARLEEGELWLVGSDIPEYAMGNRMNHEPKRKRKLLLHRAELQRFAKKAGVAGFTIIPLQLYFRRGWAKVVLALAQGKQLHDKREDLKAQTAKREIQRALGTRRSRK